jgi:hypothetical protein
VDRPFRCHCWYVAGCAAHVDDVVTAGVDGCGVAELVVVVVPTVLLDEAHQRVRVGEQVADAVSGNVQVVNAGPLDRFGVGDLHSDRRPVGPVGVVLGPGGMVDSRMLQRLRREVVLAVVDHERWTVAVDLWIRWQHGKCVVVADDPLDDVWAALGFDHSAQVGHQATNSNGVRSSRMIDMGGIRSSWRAASNANATACTRWDTVGVMSARASADSTLTDRMPSECSRRRLSARNLLCQGRFLLARRPAQRSPRCNTTTIGRPICCVTR